jgi:hypothetical protein
VCGHPATLPSSSVVSFEFFIPDLINCLNYFLSAGTHLEWKLHSAHDLTFTGIGPARGSRHVLVDIHNRCLATAFCPRSPHRLYYISLFDWASTILKVGKTFLAAGLLYPNLMVMINAGAEYFADVFRLCPEPGRAHYACFRSEVHLSPTNIQYVFDHSRS